MPNKSKRHDQDPKNSGHGSEGMGGQPDHLSRDLRGGGTPIEDDRGGGTGPVGGAFGSAQGGGSPGVEVVGALGDKGITGGMPRATGPASGPPDQQEAEQGEDDTSRGK
jgi:hypothetical protein